MGSPTGDSDEQPAHKVYVDAFSMDKYEVTVGQYAAFLQAKGIDPPSDWKTMNQIRASKAPDCQCGFGGCVSRIANGPANACRRKRSGRRRREGRMTASILGATMLRRRSTRTLGNRTGAITGYWRRWDRLKQARVPMASMIWQGMSGNGSATGTTITIIRASPSQNPTGPSSGGTKAIRGGAWNSNPRAMRSVESEPHFTDGPGTDRVPVRKDSVVSTSHNQSDIAS